MLIPKINDIGIFRVKDPLSSLIRGDIRYTVMSVRNISEIMEDDIDVKTLVYIEQGLTEHDYDNDLLIKSPIVALMSPSREYYYIPATYILSINDTTGVKFKEKVITISLGQVPDDIVLDYLFKDLEDVMISKAGLKSVVEIMDVSQDILVNDDEYSMYEKTRQTLLTKGETWKNKYLKASAEIEVLKTKMSDLIERLKSLENG